jgi:hypothetical protein
MHDVDALALPRKRERLSHSPSRNRRALGASAAVAFFLVVFGEGCGNSSSDRPAETSASKTKFPREASMPRKSIDEVIAQYTSDLLAIEGVEVVYAAQDTEHNPVITIGVTQKNDATVNALPQVLEGYPVVIQETGEIAHR